MTNRRQLTVAEAIKAADDAIKAGDLTKAERIYQALLRHGATGIQENLESLGKRLANAAATATPVQSPVDAKTTILDAHKSFLNGKYAEAEEICVELIRTEPRSRDSLILLGASQAKLLKIEKAADSFKAAISVDPKHADSHLNLASILQKLNDHKNAISASKKAITLNPGFVEAHCVLGNSLRGEGKYKEAIRAYKKCLSLNAQYTPAIQGLSRVYLLSGNMERGLDLKARAEGVICFGPDKKINILDKAING